MQLFSTIHVLALGLSSLFCAISVSAVPSLVTQRATYTNPIKPGSGADPWMLLHNDVYYLLYTTGGDVQVSTSSNIAGPWPSSGTVVYSPASDEKDLWAPELHFIDGAFYIYVAWDDGDNANHRMHVLKGTSTTDPTQPFTHVGQITSPDNNWAIDGTVLLYQNGKNYFIWSGWADSSSGNTQNLYIAEMDSPTHISSDRVLLHEPTPSWQQSLLNGNVMGINEGPEILVNNGRTFLVYSAAGSWSDDYCLAFMGIDNGADPMVPSNWWRLDDRPVMSKSDVAFGPGHASFPFDRNGVPYVVYHADATSGAGWDGRTIRTQSFGWNADSSPAFPSPAALGTEFNLPA